MVKCMSHKWKTTTLISENEVFDLLTELRGKRWLCRGQSRRHDCLKPSIDRNLRQNTSRVDKLTLERQSINIFRSTAQFFADQGEQGSLVDDIVALMVLRHYGVPTRLLDWSLSPWVATYFAVHKNDDQDGELWYFDEPLYEEVGKEQWKKWPETKLNGSFVAGLTAFTTDEPPDWFICSFYNRSFPRQFAQSGAYTMTAQFNRDHAKVIANLFKNPSCHHLYIINAKLKPILLKMLHEKHGIWRGSLYPDSAGAAETAHTVFQALASNQ
jgi:hypothetical protein